MKPEATMQLALFNAFRDTSILIPNIYWPYYEMDLMRITKAGLVHEYEIKANRADYMREFKSRTKKNKHRLMESGYKSGPNYFWYVCPPDVIKPEDIEGKKYGLIYIQGKGRVKHVNQIVNAVRMHGEHLQEGFYKKFARNLSIKLFVHGKKYN